MHNNLAAHLRKWGLTVTEVDGWQSRGSTSFTPRGIVVHHTAGGRNGNAPSLGIVTHGRPGIPGPLSQFVLGRDGRVYLVAGGKANHAGVGGALAGIPRNAGNSQCWGIEAENTGTGEPWGNAQLNAYYRLCAALCAYSNITPSRVMAHREWATPQGRKADPAGINMANFRAKVSNAFAAGPGAADGDQYLSIGDNGPEVVELQKMLVKIGYKLVTDGDFGPATDLTVRDFQVKNDLFNDGIVGPETLKTLKEKSNPVTTPVTPPAGPAKIVKPFVSFPGDGIYEVVGSRLWHITGHAWKARGLSYGDVQTVSADHPINSLTKEREE